MTSLLTRRKFISTGGLLALGAYPASLCAQSHFAQSNFGATSTAEEVTEGLDLTGKTAVVTGCNSGIGYETMRVLALRGAHVIGTARTEEKGITACSSVDGKTTPVVLELSDFDSVVKCTDQINEMDISIDMLICNAGAVYGGLQQAYGLEKTFVVNHLGHFILTNRLLDQVKSAPQGRVVVIGSKNHERAPEGGIQFDRLSGQGWGNYYAHSKLANGLFSLHLSKLLGETQATSNCAHPGGVRNTNILRNVSASSDNYPKTVAQGAATQCYVATHPALEGISGQYFADCKLADQSTYQTDGQMAEHLWSISEEITEQYLS